MRYAIGIPTRGDARLPRLRETVAAWERQDPAPDLIVVVDNNDSPLPRICRERVRIVPCDYATPGIIHGDATFLRIAEEEGFGIAGRWDDDLVPEPGCAPRLLDALKSAPAAGGVCPRPDDDHFVTVRDNAILVPDQDPRHLQFFRCDATCPRTFRRRFLYSSFLFHVDAALLVGGFCTDYSQHSYRADTDFTLRLNAYAGGWRNPGARLIVSTRAIAIHHVDPGGTRDIVGDERESMLEHDEQLFLDRMRAFGIDPDYWRSE